MRQQLLNIYRKLAKADVARGLVERKKEARPTEILKDNHGSELLARPSFDLIKANIRVEGRLMVLNCIK